MLKMKLKQNVLLNIQACKQHYFWGFKSHSPTHPGIFHHAEFLGYTVMFQGKGFPILLHRFTGRLYVFIYGPLQQRQAVGLATRFAALQGLFRAHGGSWDNRNGSFLFLVQYSQTWPKCWQPCLPTDVLQPIACVSLILSERCGF